MKLEKKSMPVEKDEHNELVEQSGSRLKGLWKRLLDR